jgi:DNA-binding ferritin-like protein (Dps family)
MSEKNAKYSKNPGEKSKKIPKKFKTKWKKIAKIFLKRGAYKSHKCESMVKNYQKEEILKCALILT